MPLIGIESPRRSDSGTILTRSASTHTSLSMFRTRLELMPLWQPGVLMPIGSRSCHALANDRSSFWRRDIVRFAARSGSHGVMTVGKSTCRCKHEGTRRCSALCAIQRGSLASISGRPSPIPTALRSSARIWASPFEGDRRKWWCEGGMGGDVRESTGLKAGAMEFHGKSAEADWR